MGRVMEDQSLKTSLKRQSGYRGLLYWYRVQYYCSLLLYSTSMNSSKWKSYECPGIGDAPRRGTGSSVRGIKVVPVGTAKARMIEKFVSKEGRF
jgi:hypothetical protein